MAEDKVLNMQDEETVVSDVLDNVNADEGYETEYRFFAGVKVPDSDEVVKDFEIREMTGADEESLQINTRKNMNEARSINKLLERCIVRIGNMTPQSVGADKWRDIIRGLNVPDADYALLMIRRLSFGNDIVLTSTCPECGAGIKTIVPLSELDIKPYGGDDSHTSPFPYVQVLLIKKVIHIIKVKCVYLRIQIEKYCYLFINKIWVKQKP